MTAGFSPRSLKTFSPSTYRGDFDGAVNEVDGNGSDGRHLHHRARDFWRASALFESGAGDGKTTRCFLLPPESIGLSSYWTLLQTRGARKYGPNGGTRGTRLGAS